MNLEDFRNFCLEKKASEEDFPFTKDILVFKVMGKMFALTNINSWESGIPEVNLKCEPEKAEELRAKYPESILPGYHMHKKHWNTIKIYHKDITPSLLTTLINHSYQLVIQKLTKKQQQQLNEHF